MSDPPLGYMLLRFRSVGHSIDAACASKEAVQSTSRHDPICSDYYDDRGREGLAIHAAVTVYLTD